MKKILILLVGLLVLAGCSASGETYISDSKNLFTIGNTTINTKDLYEVLKRNDGGNQVIKDSQNILTENTELTEDMKTEADERWNQLISMYGEEFILSYSGFDTKEEYLEKTVYPELKMISVLKALIKENMSEVETTYVPRLIKIMNYTDKETAESAYNALTTDGKSVEEVVKEFPASETYNGKETVYLKGIDTNIPADVSSYIESATLPGLSTIQEVTVNQITSYYIIQVLETAPANFEAQILDSMLSNESIVNNYLGLLFRENNFKVYDESLHTALQKNYSNYFKATE